MDANPNDGRRIRICCVQILMKGKGAEADMCNSMFLLVGFHTKCMVLRMGCCSSGPCILCFIDMAQHRVQVRIRCCGSFEKNAKLRDNGKVPWTGLGFQRGRLRID